MMPTYAVVGGRRKNCNVPGVNVRHDRLRPHLDDGNLLSSSSDDENGSELLRRSPIYSNSRQWKPIPPPRTRIPILARGIYSNIPGTPLPIRHEVTPDEPPGTLSRGGSLDRKLADMRKLNFGELREKRRKEIEAVASEFHDYSEIYTPSQESKRFDDGRPPTPPLHRCPSWETRIYELATRVIHSTTSTPYPSMRSQKKVNKESESCQPFYRMNAPVFASIQGRASQIRSMPFSGDSSDSSDNETYCRVTTGTSSTSGECSDLYLTPIRRVRRGLSVESALSEDYAVPPDALPSAASEDALGTFDPCFEPKTPKRFSSLQRSNMSPSKSYDTIEKSGYLTKLGGKLKSWKRRWFILKDGTLYYYRSQSDSFKNKTRGHVPLDETCRIVRVEGSGSFQVVSGTNKHTYYLTAESITNMEEWIKCLQNALKKHAKAIFTRDDTYATIDGWLTKVKHGHSKRCWCVLVSKTFFYFKNCNESVPLGQINMKEAKVKEVTNLSDSDSDENEKNQMSNASNASTGVSYNASDYTIAIYPKPDSSPVYLLSTNKQEMDSWLYHLTVVSQCDDVTGTQFEHLMSKLMQSDSDTDLSRVDSNPLWSDQLLLHTRECIASPLTTLPTESLRRDAIELFKSIQLFSSVQINPSGIDYHVSLIQNSLNLCLTQHELQGELFCQLIKLTTPHHQSKLCTGLGMQHFLLCATQTIFSCESASGTSSEKTSPTYPQTTSQCVTSPVKSLDKANPPAHVFTQVFQILALTVSLFVPKGRVLWLLKHHLRRSSDTKSEAGKYAIYCQRALERILCNGGRENRPSRTEVLGILLRNPYAHSLPHSMPVNFANSTYMVIGFDGSTTIDEFVNKVSFDAGIRPPSQSGFALFSDDPIDKDTEHQLRGNIKLADIISKWELALREKHLGKLETTKVVKLLYKNRLYMKQHIKSETDKERLLLTSQIHSSVMQNKFPLTKELAIQLAALMAQIEFGDAIRKRMSSGDGSLLDKVFSRFFPEEVFNEYPRACLIQEMKDKWNDLKKLNSTESVRIYLNCARKWPLCGATLFEAETVKSIKSEKCVIVASSVKIWLAVSDDGVDVLDYDSKQILTSIQYQGIMTFGGCKDDFMLVVNHKRPISEPDSGSLSGSASGGSAGGSSFRSEKHLFTMSKSKIIDITLLIADYMNVTQKSSLLRGEKFLTNSSKVSRATSFRTNPTLSPSHHKVT